MFDRLPPTQMDTLTTSDGVRLFTQSWLPDHRDSPRGTVLIIHGHGEHSGRYSHVARHLVEHGFAVRTYDQRGFGRSEGRRGLVESFGQLVDDLALFVQHVRRTSDDPPYMLFAHSMGGPVAILYVLEHAAPVDGAVLSSPAIDVSANTNALLRAIAPVVSRLLPTLPTVATPNNAISRDPKVVREAETDPLNYDGRILARTGTELLRASERVQKQAHRFTLPFFLIHGGADQLTNPAASRRFYEQAASDDKTLKLYDGLYHETFNEPEKEDVLRDIADWLLERC